MPFVEATILETLRIADINPYSVTHAACEDVDMKGLVIPKGSIIVPNIHSVHHDPALWGDPEVFRPERFLDEKGVVVKPENLIPFFLGQFVVGDICLFVCLTHTKKGMSEQLPMRLTKQNSSREIYSPIRYIKNN